jgi:hypothetical protein
LLERSGAEESVEVRVEVEARGAAAAAWVLEEEQEGIVSVVVKLESTDR